MDGRTWLSRNQHRLMGVVALALVLGTTAAVYQAESQPRCDGVGVLGTASGPEPAALATGQAGQLAVTRTVPLLVDQRLRVFTSGDRIWSEPVAAHGTKQYWSCTRSAHSITGVVADAGPSATVVAQWSDGRLDGIDAKTGAVRWATTVAPDATADTSSPLWPMYPESGLFMLASGAGDTVLVVRPGELQGLDAASGRPRWTRALSGADCAGPGFTTPATLAGLDVVQAYVFHDTCAGVEREVDPATGRDVRTFAPDLKAAGEKAGTGWQVVPDACLWHNVGCAVFSWLFDSGDAQGVDILPPFVQVSDLPTPPQPFLSDLRGWGTDQAGSPNVALGFGTSVIHVSGVPGVQGWNADGVRSWANRRATGYLYGTGQRVYEFSPQQVDIITPATGELTTDVTVRGISALAAVIVQGDLAVLVSPDRAAAIVVTG